MLLDNITNMAIEGNTVSSLYLNGSQIWTAESTASGLEAYTWAELRAMSAAGETGIFNYGEEKTVTFGDGKVAKFCYIGNEADTNGVVGMVFMQVDNFYSFQWHSSSSTWKTYSGASISSSLSSKFYTSDAGEHSRIIRKYYQNKNNATTTTSNTFQVWLPSWKELFNVDMPCVINNGVVYEYTQTEEFQEKLRKGLKDGETDLGSYIWLRDNDSTGYAYHGTYNGKTKLLKGWTSSYPSPMVFCV